MAYTIIVMGESGSGKSTSLRNLDPETTCIIDADKKGLPWRGWRKHYSREAGNYMVSDDQDAIMAAFEKIEANPKWKVAVVDTINGIMVADEWRRKDEKTYDKWQDLAWSVYGLFRRALTMRDDLTVVFVAHVDNLENNDGSKSTRVKTSGKMLSKIVLESMVKTCLLCLKTRDGHFFATHPFDSTGKTPPNLYEEELIDNDLSKVVDDIWKYEYGE